MGVPPSIDWTDDESDGAESTLGEASAGDHGDASGGVNGASSGAGTPNSGGDSKADQFTMVELPRGDAPTPTHPYPRGVEIPLRVEVVRVWETDGPATARERRRRRRRRRRALTDASGTSGDTGAGDDPPPLSVDGLDAKSLYFASKYQVGRRTHLPGRPPSPSDSSTAGGASGARGVPREIADAPEQMRGTFTTRRPRRASVADFADGLGLQDWEHNPAGARGPSMASPMAESGDDDKSVVWGAAAVAEAKAAEPDTVPWLWDSNEERAGFEAFVAVRDYIEALRTGGESAARQVPVAAGAMESWASHVRARQAFDAWALGSGSEAAGPIGPDQVLAWLMTAQGTPEAEGIAWVMPPGCSPPQPAAASAEDASSDQAQGA